MCPISRAHNEEARERLFPKPVAVIALCSVSLIGPAGAQEDLTEPPRITDTPSSLSPAESLGVAPTPDEDRQEQLEEIIVVRENRWRLPDLGSDWRSRQEAEPDTGRIEVDFLPLFDPETEQDPFGDYFPLNRELARVGYIEVFRVRFGRR
jgi:hypothetical protein